MATPLHPGTAQIRELLERMSLGQLARRVGVERSTVLRWARGAVPRPSAQRQLRASFGLAFEVWERGALHAGPALLR